ncbi:MAG: single-stranded-DNA-specific exonuclease RecJ [Balneolaceae bacterium]
MSFRWIYSELEQQNSIEELQQQLGVPCEIAQLLALRDINTFSKAKTFFRPEIGHLHDPFLMKDMEEASLRLSKAVKDAEKVLVYGDYDVDGTTATASVLLFLRGFGLDVTYYIPHRFKEGYGISSGGITHAREIGADLIVSVDCGITAFEEAKQAREAGIDLIICDHHTAEDRIPEAVAVLDPKRPDCSYPFDGLSGAGVGYKLIEATVTKLGLSAEVAYQFLDLIAISIASDIVPVIDENRVMMRRGLHMINNCPRPGIKALLDLVNATSGSVSTSTIIYSIGPRINAAGRMGDAGTAVELMISDNTEESKKVAADLETINRKRRSTDQKTLEEAQAMLDDEGDMDDVSTLVLHDPDWHLGVIGIVASRLVDTFNRPVVMLSSVDGKVKGSARSVKGFNIYQALKKCEDLLEQFGGHEYAAGLTMNQKNIAEFRERMNDIACSALSGDDFKPALTIDSRIDLSEIDRKFWKLLSQFEPYGPGNLKPVFVSEDVQLSGVPSIVGKGHLKLKLRQNGSCTFDAIGFKMHNYMPLVRDSGSRRIDVAYVIEENRWNNNRNLQLRLEDIRVKN